MKPQYTKKTFSNWGREPLATRLETELVDFQSKIDSEGVDISELNAVADLVIAVGRKADALAHKILAQSHLFDFWLNFFQYLSEENPPKLKTILDTPIANYPDSFVTALCFWACRSGKDYSNGIVITETSGKLSRINRAIKSNEYLVPSKTTFRDCVAAAMYTPPSEFSQVRQTDYMKLVFPYLACLPNSYWDRIQQQSIFPENDISLISSLRRKWGLYSEEKLKGSIKNWVEELTNGGIGDRWVASITQDLAVNGYISSGYLLYSYHEEDLPQSGAILEEARHKNNAAGDYLVFYEERRSHPVLHLPDLPPLHRLATQPLSINTEIYQTEYEQLVRGEIEKVSITRLITSAQWLIAELAEAETVDQGDWWKMLLSPDRIWFLSHCWDSLSNETKTRIELIAELLFRDKSFDCLKTVKMMDTPLDVLDRQAQAGNPIDVKILGDLPAKVMSAIQAKDTYPYLYPYALKALLSNPQNRVNGFDTEKLIAELIEQHKQERGINLAGDKGSVPGVVRNFVNKYLSKPLGVGNFREFADNPQEVETFIKFTTRLKLPNRLTAEAVALADQFPDSLREADYEVRYLPVHGLGHSTRVTANDNYHWELVQSNLGSSAEVKNRSNNEEFLKGVVLYWQNAELSLTDRVKTKEAYYLARRYLFIHKLRKILSLKNYFQHGMTYLVERLIRDFGFDTKEALPEFVETALLLEDPSSGLDYFTSLRGVLDELTRQGTVFEVDLGSAMKYLFKHDASTHTPSAILCSYLSSKSLEEEVAASRERELREEERQALEAILLQQPDSSSMLKGLILKELTPIAEVAKRVLADLPPAVMDVIINIIHFRSKPSRLNLSGILETAGQVYEFISYVARLPYSSLLVEVAADAVDLLPDDRQYVFQHTLLAATLSGQGSVYEGKKALLEGNLPDLLVHFVNRKDATLGVLRAFSESGELSQFQLVKYKAAYFLALRAYFYHQCRELKDAEQLNPESLVQTIGNCGYEATDAQIELLEALKLLPNLKPDLYTAIVDCINTSPPSSPLRKLTDLPNIIANTKTPELFSSWEAPRNEKVRALTLNRSLCERMVIEGNTPPEFHEDVLHLVAGLDPTGQSAETQNPEVFLESLSTSVYERVPAIARMIDVVYPNRSRINEINEEDTLQLIRSLDLADLGTTIYIVRALYYTFVEITGNVNDAFSQVDTFLQKLINLGTETGLDIGYLAYLDRDLTRRPTSQGENIKLFLCGLSGHTILPNHSWGDDDEELLETKISKDLPILVYTLIALKYGDLNEELLEYIYDGKAQSQLAYLLSSQIQNKLQKPNEVAGFRKQLLVQLYHTGDIVRADLPEELLSNVEVMKPMNLFTYRFNTPNLAYESLGEAVADIELEELLPQLNNYKVPQKAILNESELQVLMQFIFFYEKGLLPKLKLYNVYVQARRKFAEINSRDSRFIQSLVNDVDLSTLIYLIRHSLINSSRVSKYIDSQGLDFPLHTKGILSIAESADHISYLESISEEKLQLVLAYLAYDCELLEQLLINSNGFTNDSPWAGLLLEAVLRSDRMVVGKYHTPVLDRLPYSKVVKNIDSVRLWSELRSAQTYPHLRTDLHRISLVTAPIDGTTITSDILGSLLLGEDPDKNTIEFLKNMIDSTLSDMNELIGMQAGTIIGPSAQEATSFEGVSFKILLPDEEKLPKAKLGILRGLVSQFLAYYEKLNLLDPEYILNGIPSRYPELVKVLTLLFELQIFNVGDLQGARNVVRQHILIQLATAKWIEPAQLTVAMVVKEFKELCLGVSVPGVFWQAGIDKFKEKTGGIALGEVPNQTGEGITWGAINRLTFPIYQQLLPDVIGLQSARKRRNADLSEGMLMPGQEGRGAEILLVNRLEKSRAGREVRARETKLLRDLGDIEQSLHHQISGSQSIREPDIKQQEYIATKLVEFARFVVENEVMFNKGQSYIQIEALFRQLLAVQDKSKLRDAIAGLYKGTDDVQKMLGNPIFSWVLMLANEANRRLFINYVSSSPENFLMLLRYMLVGVGRHIVLKKSDSALADLLIEPPARSDVNNDLKAKLVDFAETLCEDQTTPTPQQRMLPIIRDIEKIVMLAANLQVNPRLDSEVEDWLHRTTQVFDSVIGDWAEPDQVVVRRRELAEGQWGNTLVTGLEINKREYVELNKLLSKQLRRYGMMAVIPIIIMISSFLFTNRDQVAKVFVSLEQDSSEEVDPSLTGLDIVDLAEHYQQYTPESIILENVESRVIGKVLHNSLGASGGSGVNLAVPYSGQILPALQSMTGNKPPTERLTNIDQLRVLPDQSFVYTVYAPKVIWPSDWSRKIEKLVLLGEWEGEPEYDIYGNLIVDDRDVGKRIVIVEVANPDYKLLGKGIQLVEDPYENPVHVTAGRGEDIRGLLLDPAIEAIYVGIYDGQPTGIDALNRLLSLQSMLWEQIFSRHRYSPQLPMESETNQQLMESVIQGVLSAYYCTVAGNVSAELYADLGYPVTFINSTPVYIQGGLMITDLSHRTIQVGPVVIDNTPSILSSGSTIISDGAFAVELPDAASYANLDDVLLELRGYLQEIARQKELRDSLKILLVGGVINSILIVILISRIHRRNVARRNQARVVLESIELIISDPRKVYELAPDLQTRISPLVVDAASKIASVDEPIHPIRNQISQIVISGNKEFPTGQLLEMLGDILMILAFYTQLTSEIASLNRVEQLIVHLMTTEFFDGFETEMAGTIEELQQLVKEIEHYTGVSRFILDEDLEQLYRTSGDGVKVIIDNTMKVVRTAKLAGFTLLPLQVQNASLVAELHSKREALLTKLNARIRQGGRLKVNALGKAIIDILQLGQ
ncbi:MAG: hypothetical protein JNK26_01225 [Candidatus Doudnabacteria bacterium]|nr:hypothetical protein [Candidatus Doudnabacteria bacterium]